MKLFAGFDGGGTKTCCVLCTEEGRLLGIGYGGPSNYLYCGREIAAQSVRDSWEQAFWRASLTPQPLDTAYMASAAIRLHGGRNHVPFFQTCIEADSLICESDIYPIWFGAVREKPAVVSIAGTGSITHVCRPGDFQRVGGWGPLLGDDGSGYAIGLQTLRLAARMWDGLEEPDEELLQKIRQLYSLGQDERSLIRELNRGDVRSRVAASAKLVTELAVEGNPTAVCLLEEAARDIACAIAGALRRDAGKDRLPLILSGGLLQPTGPMFAWIQRHIQEMTDRIDRVEPAAQLPAIAAAALALYNTGRTQAAETLLSRTETEAR